MNKLVHISDLHFGTEDKGMTNKLAETINEIGPECVVISGDLTQRARASQYKAAKEFMDKLPYQKIVVPGNHDVPLFNVFSRIFMPLKNYHKYITTVMDPLYYENGMAVFGINTARSFTWKEGRISIEQMENLRDKLCSIPDDVFKVVVTHHPFIPPPDDSGIRLVGRSVKALDIIARCKIDLLLAGHLHQGYSGDIRPYYPDAKKSVIVAQAGTAVSQRVREEPNAFNLIRLDRDTIEITIMEWNDNRFEKTKVTTYQKTEDEWVRE